ncbi:MULTISPECIES: ATP-binding protein [Nostoc]|uniref:histidine kinase n=1 Tax=Nostoc paludosum FACHB-159 TaxID=2692908 RepID=A0ABR8K995_9NOSO|nr:MULTISPECIES: ATP-binding protein [Nostoc]MBD2679806.1 hybrid sensor histidine kinase/response regulator [Nostoc sp. FACHB-857]MBD2736055.1 hybrid sensor histidine kinase/response regulator [Nostoc paludosum FACHB-159]
MLQKSFNILEENLFTNVASSNNDNSNNLDDELVFAAEIDDELPAESWKILIVDDESEVHTATNIALTNFIFEDKSLSFINAYSASHAKQLIEQNSDIAIILLDVIMETDNAGLEFVQYVREVLGNQLVRIILRTGQPGHVPEKEIIFNYDINDYKTKTELTSQKLYTTMLTALRSYSLSQRLQLEIERCQQIEMALRDSERREREKAIALENSLKTLQHTQLQLVQSEKMSSLGQLVAGIAHEINNPVNFLYGNLLPTQEYIQQLIELLEIYELHYPNPAPEIIDRVEEIDLPFIISDLPKLLSSMKLGADRIRQIVLSLRNFSRLDDTQKKPVNIHEGIDSTLMILQHRLKANSERPAIEVIKKYGALPSVTCYAGQLNQVFMNLLANAIDALEDVDCTQDCLTSQPQILIHTETVGGDRVRISIADNGVGMTENVRSRIFNSFFTTKPMGKGTGMGLSISQQIVAEKHGGQLECLSSHCQGTKFIIEIPIG